MGLWIFFDVIGTVNRVNMLEKLIMVKTDLESKVIDINNIVPARSL
jgi:hypothetical protein